MPYLPNQFNTQYSAYGYPNYMNASSTPAPMQTPPQNGGIVWVDGEVGAKAYQIPTGHPPNTPIALWDTNDTIIYLKSVNQMGMPNPLQKIHYKMEEQPSGYIQNGMSGSTNSSKEVTQYATKADIEQLREEMKTYLNRGETK